MRGAAATVLSAVMLTGCSAAPPVPAAAAGLTRCIPAEQIVGRRTAGAAAVDFELLGGLVYRNQLRGSCPGLARLGSAATVSIASGGEGGQLCAGDRIRVLDPIEGRGTGASSYPTCILGQFSAAPMPR